MVPAVSAIAADVGAIAAEDGAIAAEDDAIAADAERACNEVLARATRLLAQREHGRAELRSKLAARGFDAGVIDQVLDRLRADGLQSEQRFAAALVRRRIGRGYGPVYIRGELRERKVDDEVADAEMNQTDAYWLQLAVQALAGKFPQRNGESAAYNKRARFLARRGFPADIVYRALNTCRERG